MKNNILKSQSILLLSVLCCLGLPNNAVNAAPYFPPGVDAMALASHIGVLWGTAELCGYARATQFPQFAKDAIIRRQWKKPDADSVWKQVEAGRHLLKQNPDLQNPAMRTYVCTKELSVYNESNVWKPGWVFGQ